MTEWTLMKIARMTESDYYVIVVKACFCLCTCHLNCGTCADLFVSVLLNYKGSYAETEREHFIFGSRYSQQLRFSSDTLHLNRKRNDTTPDTANTAYLSCGCEKAISCSQLSAVTHTYRVSQKSRLGTGLHYEDGNLLLLFSASLLFTLEIPGLQGDHGTPISQCNACSWVIVTISIQYVFDTALNQKYSIIALIWNSYFLNKILKSDRSGCVDSFN